MKLIGLSGRKQSGKDTVCNLIGALVGSDKVARVAFADALKIEVYDWIEQGMPVEGIPEVVLLEAILICYLEPQPLNATEEEKLLWVDRNKEKLRKLLQVWGTDYRRAISDTYWIHMCRNKVAAKASEGYRVIVVTDCRFPNEAEMVTDLGGDVVLIARPGLPSDDDHPSERSMGDYDNYAHGIVNEGSIPDLKAKVDKMCRLLGLYQPPKWTRGHAEGVVRGFDFPECPVDS